MTNRDDESVRDAFVTLLRACADHVSTLTADEVRVLLDGKLELRLSVVNKAKKPKRRKAAPLDAAKLPQIASRLRALDNRAEGERLLAEVAPSRSALDMLARYLDVAVRRDDRIDDLLHRIIEATIGFRLSSAAVQGQTALRRHDERSSPLSARAKE